MRNSKWDQSVVKGALEVRSALPYWLKPETTREFNRVRPEAKQVQTEKVAEPARSRHLK